MSRMGPRISTSSAHTSSPGGSPDHIRLRLRQADVIPAHVRDFETPGEHLDLPDQTPFVILGDFNADATEPAWHLETLFEEDIDP